MKRVVWKLPGLGGVVSDFYETNVMTPSIVDATDAQMRDGRIRVRKGWTTIGSTTVTGSGVAKVHFKDKATTKIITTTSANAFFYDSTSGSSSIQLGITGGGSGLAPATGGVYYPKCFYNGYLLICDEQGIGPSMFYKGTQISTSSIPSLVATFTDETSHFTINAGSSTDEADVESGGFMHWTGGVGWYGGASNGGTGFFTEIDAWDSSGFIGSIKDVILEQTVTAHTFKVFNFCWSYPCVIQYNKGTLSYSSTNDEVIGLGTKWLSDGLFTGASLYADAVMTYETNGMAGIANVFNIDSDTDIDLINVLTTRSNLKYEILRACCFGHARVYRNSLVGSRVKARPSSLFIGPPNWNPLLPPGVVAPWRPVLTNDAQYPPDFHKLFEIGVPTLADTDEIISHESTYDGILVFKARSTHLIRGIYPTFNQQIISHSIGCVSHHASVSCDFGVFWIDEHGVYTWQGGRVVNLTEKVYQQKFENVIAGVSPSNYIAQISIGEHDGYLFCNLNGTVLVYDIRMGFWCGTWTNQGLGPYWSSSVPDEGSQLLNVNSSKVRVISNQTEPSTTTYQDSNGSGPTFSITLGSSPLGDIALQTRAIQYQIIGVFQSTSGTQTMAASLVSTGSLLRADPDDDNTKALGNITFENETNIVKRTFKPLRGGYSHKLILTQNQTNLTTTPRCEIHEIVGDFRVGRS